MTGAAGAHDGRGGCSTPAPATQLVTSDFVEASVERRVAARGLGRHVDADGHDGRGG